MELMLGRPFSLCKAFKLNCLPTLWNTEVGCSAMNPQYPSAWKNSSPKFRQVPAESRTECNQGPLVCITRQQRRLTPRSTGPATAGHLGPD